MPAVLTGCAAPTWIVGWVACAGLARFSGVDAWLWRLAFTLLVIMAGTGLLVYVLMWILVPLEPEVPGLPLSSNH